MKKIILTKEQLDEIAVNGGNVDNGSGLIPKQPEVRSNASKVGAPTTYNVGDNNRTGNEEPIQLSGNIDDPKQLPELIKAADKAGYASVTLGTNDLENVSENTIRISKRNLDRFLLS